MSRSLDQLDNDLGVIEALLEDAPVQDMDEMSFPIAEKALNSLQWQAVSVATGSGIADRGGRPFWLRNLSNTTDSAHLTVSTTTKTAEASIMGFFFQMKKDVQVSLPPVSSPTTYHIGLEFDPTRLKDETGPIRRVVHKNTIPYTGGKIYLPLWEVTRKPNQLLSDAKVVQKRPKISPTIHVDYPESMPDPRTQLWGATCYIRLGAERGTTYVASGSSEETGGPTDWVRQPTYSAVNVPSTPDAPYVWEDRRIEREGNKRRLYGRVRRDNGKDFTTRSEGWGVHAFDPKDAASTQSRRSGVVAGSGATSPSFAKVSVESNGIYMYPASDAPWFDFNGFEWTVN